MDGGTLAPKTTDWRLVGRSPLLRTLRSLLAGETSGANRGAVLVGAAGVGKSRLAAECRILAEQAGYTTAKLIATASARSIPFGAWAPLLPPLPAQGAEPASILRLALDALTERANGTMLLVSVDDAHLLDESSAALLHQAAATGTAFVVVTVRTGERVPDPVVALWKDGLATRLEIAPLSEADLPLLLEEALDGPVDAAARQLIWRASEGNPLLTRELIAAATDEGTLVCADGVWRLTRTPTESPRLVDLIESRVGRLDEDERAALETLSIGQPLGIRLLEQLGYGEALERLERRDLIAVRTDGRRTEVVISHPLYADIVRSRMPTLRARARTRGLAEALAQTGSRRRVDLLHLAVWCLDSGDPRDPVLLISAAREAAARFDQGLVVRLARAASECGGGASALHLLGDGLAKLGQLDEADTAFAAAASLATNDAERAMVAFARSDNLFWGLGRTADAFAVLADTSDAVTEPLWRDALTCIRAGVEINSGGLQQSLESVGDLLEHDEPFVAVSAAIVAEGAYLLLGREREAIALARRAHGVHVAARDLLPLFDPALHRFIEALALCELGDVAGAERLAARELEEALAAGNDRARVWLTTALGRTRLVIGDVLGALVLLREAAPLFRAVGQFGLSRLSLATLAIAAATTGDAETATDAVSRADTLGESAQLVYGAELERARAWIAVARDAIDDAARLFESAAAVAREREEVVTEALSWHDLVRIGHLIDPPIARRAADRLEALAKMGEGPFPIARAAHARAIVDRDPEALLEAAAQLEAMPAPLMAGEAAAVASELLAARGDARSAAAARRRAVDFVARSQGARTPAIVRLDDATATAQLSDRVLLVARLAASGLTDRQIAEQEFLSVRTVSNYLARAYVTLGIEGRDQLPIALERFH